MQSSLFTRRLTSYSKLAKFNIIILALLMVAITTVVSFADEVETGSVSATSSCGAKVSLVLDRSSSIGVPEFNGSQAFIDSVRNGAGELVKALKGNDSYLDYYAFASNAKRADQENRHQLTDAKVNTLVSRLSTLKFKTSTAVDTYTDDGINAAGEGLTNWEQALTTVENYSNYQGLPRHIVIFTDGEPTTNVPHLNAAIAAGGSYTAAGYAGEDGVSPDDLSRAFTVADRLRSKGVTIIAVGVGDTAGYANNLNRLAGGAGNVYMASNINQLSAKFKEAASRLCVAKSVVLYKALEKKADGTTTPIKLPVVSRSQHNDGTSNEEVNVTTTNGTPEWVAAPDGGRSFTKGFDVRGTATIPTGYRAVSDECRLLSTTGTPAITQVAPANSDPKQVLIQNVAAGSWVGCTFIVEKIPTTTTSSSTTTTSTTKPECNTCSPSKIEIVKTVNPTTAKPGDTVTYSFVVTNTGSNKLINVKVTDPMLGGQVGATIPSLNPGQSAPVITKTYVIPANATGKIHNVATATGTTQYTDGKTGPNVHDDDDADVTVTSPVTSWTASKKADKSVVTPGETVNYTITVKNTGETTLTNLEVSDPTIDFPADGKPVIIASLAPGASKDITASYVIPANYSGNTFKNTAVVCLPKTGQTQDCKNPSVEVEVARLSITKTADKTTAFPGEKVVYTFVVKNTGGATIDPTVIVDDILGNIGDPGVLKPGESQTFTKEFTVPTTAQAGSTIKNTATVCAPVPGKTQPTLSATDCKTTCPADATATLCDQDDHTLTIVIPSLSIVKTASADTANVGDTVTYTFVITNTSKVTLTNISVVDNVLGDLGTIDKLEPGASVTKSVQYIVPTTAATAGTIRNVATACFANPVYTPNCASDDHTLTVTVVQGTVATRPPTTVSNSTLAFTGAQSIWLATIGALFIGLGAVIFVIARRRNSTLF